MPNAHEIEVGRRFDQVAARYDREDQYPVRDEVRRRVVELLRDLAPRRVLDVGCGTGTLLLDLLPHIEFGLGLDVSEGMLSIASAKAARHGVGHRLRFQTRGFSDLTALLNAERPFDAAVCTYAMHHLRWKDKVTAIRSLAAAVAADGTVVIGDLMFFEDPTHFSPAEQLCAGYDPSTDLPETPAQLQSVLSDQRWRVTARPVHALAGILTATRVPRLHTSSTSNPPSPR